MPTPILNFDGITLPTAVCNCAPPDTNGEVGPNNYVQIVNTAYAVWDKSGTPTRWPRGHQHPLGGLRRPVPDPQRRRPGGQLRPARRSLGDQPVHQRRALLPVRSRIADGDPTGAFYRYAFLESNTIFGDYPKMGVWPDGYYMSTNEFDRQ